MNMATSTSIEKTGMSLPMLWEPTRENRIEEIINTIEYLLRMGSNAQGVRRDVDKIIPEIESLLKELKRALREERKKEKEKKNTKN